MSRGYVAAQFVGEGVLRTIAEKVNGDYGCQQTMLMIGLLTFAVWLVLFLLWWIFGVWTIANRKE
ncbi:MAG: hypothetical protein NT096_09180 [Proteobacteria bacterium]|nr:hypothetical protein [Pseudomonadota bacterium]